MPCTVRCASYRSTSQWQSLTHSSQLRRSSLLGSYFQATVIIRIGVTSIRVNSLVTGPAADVGGPGGTPPLHLPIWTNHNPFTRCATICPKCSFTVCQHANHRPTATCTPHSGDISCSKQQVAGGRATPI